MDWIARDISEELEAWGHAGCVGGKIATKCGGEAGIKAARCAVAKYHGGVVILENPAKGESNPD